MSRVDLYKALWGESGEVMPADRIKKLSCGRRVVAEAYVKQKREQREIRQQLLAVAAAAQRQALENAVPAAVVEPDEQNMETDRSSHSDAPRSSNSVDMRTVSSFGPSTSSPSTRNASKSGDDMSVDSSGVKARSGDSMSVGDVFLEEDAKDEGENVAETKADGTLYDVAEPASDSSGSKSASTKETQSEDTTEEVSSKHSLDGADSLPDDDAEQLDTGAEWMMELPDEDSVDPPVDLKLAEEDPVEQGEEDSVEQSKEDPMDVIVGKLSAAGIRSQKRGSPGKSAEESPRKAKEVRKSSEHDETFKSPPKVAARRTFPTEHQMAQQTPPRQRSVSESGATERPMVDASSPSLRRSSPRVSGQRPSPKKKTSEVTSPTIVISPPADEDEDDDL